MVGFDGVCSQAMHSTSQQLKGWRCFMGMSQSEFARHFGIPLKTLQAWEQGSREPSPYIVRMVHDILRLERRPDDHIEILYELLRSKFGADDIVYCYHSGECDPEIDDVLFGSTFYVRSRGLYLDLFTAARHGEGWFDLDQEIERQENGCYDKWSAKQELYKRVHCELDVEKREYAEDNKLNYVVFWTIQDIYDWFYLGCPDGHDWAMERSWHTKKAFDDVLSDVVSLYLDDGSVRFDADQFDCGDYRFEFDCESLLECPVGWQKCTIVFSDARLLPEYVKVFINSDKTRLCIDNGGSLVYYNIVVR